DPALRRDDDCFVSCLTSVVSTGSGMGWARARSLAQTREQKASRDGISMSAIGGSVWPKIRLSGFVAGGRENWGGVIVRPRVRLVSAHPGRHARHTPSRPETTAVVTALKVGFCVKRRVFRVLTSC